MNSAESPAPSTSKSSALEQKQQKPNSKPSTQAERNDNHRTDAKKSRHRNERNKPNERNGRNKPNERNNTDDGKIFQQMKEDVNNALEQCSPGCELDLLFEILRPSYKQMWSNNRAVKQDLLSALRRTYPETRIEVFGSTVMGVAFKDSDFDFYVNLSHEPLKLSPAGIIGKTMHLLNQSKLFTNFCPIARARVPILKCYHIQTGYQCDLNFTDSYGMLNSPIVAKLLSSDQRVCALATVIKYWAKLHDCTGINRISSYALMWMIIYYLQQLEEPVLPAFIEFQRHVPPVYVNHYNFAFDTNFKFMTRNCWRFSELLLGFFKFYSKFDFASNIICPLYGKTIPKKDIDKLCEELQRYKDILVIQRTERPQKMQLNKKMCIQDPFQLTRTIPGDISLKEFRKIELRFGYTVDIVEALLKQFGESTMMLQAMFDVASYDAYLEKMRQPLHEKRVKATQIIGSHTSKNGFCSGHLIPTKDHLTMIRKYMKKQNKLSDSKTDAQDIQRIWSEKMVEFLIVSLEEIFLCTRHPNTLSESFIIVGTRDVFIGRKQIRPMTTKSFEKEKLISKERIRESIPMQLNASVKISTDLTKFEFVDIEFTDLKRTKKNNSFRSFTNTFFNTMNHLLTTYFLQLAWN